MPLHILIKPASGYCNMNCSYCFYADEMNHRDEQYHGMMSERTLEMIIKKSLAFAKDSITFAYQGGEPTLRGVEFFRTAIKLQKKWNINNIAIHNAMQTNGYAVDEEWCRLFKEHNFLVGLSLDGTLKTHDHNRKNRDGKGTYLRCLETVRLFEEYQVEYNILTVVNRQTAPKIRRIYQDYKKKGFGYQQYIACLDPLFDQAGKEAYSLTPEQYGEFLINLFEMWLGDFRYGRHSSNRLFENYVMILKGYPPESCEQNGICGIQNVIEADGRVYPCDFYMLDKYCIGNIHTEEWDQIYKNRQEIKFIADSYNHSERCRQCPYYHLCRGGCRRLRIKDQQTGDFENYFCKAYRMFFDKYYDVLKELAADKIGNGLY